MEAMISDLARMSFFKESETTECNIDMEVENCFTSKKPANDMEKTCVVEDAACIQNSDTTIEKNTKFEKKQLPPRAAKRCTNDLSVKHRVISKPNKCNQNKSLKSFTNIKPEDLINLYTNTSVKNFKPTCLETIIEEPSDIDCAKYENIRFMKNRKCKRALNCCTGTKADKGIINKRRNKIKKVFGRRLALKKISLEEFIEKFSSIDNNEEHRESAIAFNLDHSDNASNTKTDLNTSVSAQTL